MPGPQNDDLIGQSHGFDLIVSHIDHRGTDLFVKTCDFYTHVDTQFGVEVGQGFVKQKHLWPTDNRPANRNPLALTTRKRLWFAFQILVELQDRRGLGDFLFDLGLRDAIHAQAEAHVFFDRHMRIERVGLKHHGDAAIGRVSMRHIARANVDLARGCFFEASDHPQKGGFATARRANKNTELAVVDR